MRTVGASEPGFRGRQLGLLSGFGETKHYTNIKATEASVFYYNFQFPIPLNENIPKFFFVLDLSFVMSLNSPPPAGERLGISSYCDPAPTQASAF